MVRRPRKVEKHEWLGSGPMEPTSQRQAPDRVAQYCQEPSETWRPCLAWCQLTLPQSGEGVKASVQVAMEQCPIHNHSRKLTHDQISSVPFSPNHVRFSSRSPPRVFPF